MRATIRGRPSCRLRTTSIVTTFMKAPLPAPAGTVAASGIPSPRVGSDVRNYYGYYSGQADPPNPEDRPLSQEEIDRIRLGNGIPKGGLL